MDAHEQNADEPVRDASHEGGPPREPYPWFGVNFLAPWEHKFMACCFQVAGGKAMEDPYFIKAMQDLLLERNRLHEVYIREEAKTARLNLVIGAILFVAGALVIVFAPTGREAVVQWVGAAILVVSAGVAGYKQVWGKSQFLEVGAGSTREPSQPSRADRKPRAAAPLLPAAPAPSSPTKS